MLLEHFTFSLLQKPTHVRNATPQWTEERRIETFGFYHGFIKILWQEKRGLSLRILMPKTAAIYEANMAQNDFKIDNFKEKSNGKILKPFLL